jgi:hypothetical protein
LKRSSCEGSSANTAFELGLEQVEPGDLAVAMVGGNVEPLGLFKSRLADGFAQ